MLRRQLLSQFTTVQDHFRRQTCLYSQQSSSVPLPPHIHMLASPTDSAEARSWIARFQAISIPKDLVKLTFSRSSGPGGQVCCRHIHSRKLATLLIGIVSHAKNVNKVNTKATLRCAVDSPWIPLWAKPELAKSVCNFLLERRVFHLTANYSHSTRLRRTRS
jgi:hypothetical protein